MSRTYTNPRKVYVGSICRSVSESEVEDLFSDMGRIASFEYKGDFCFVEYFDENDARRAIEFVFLLYLLSLAFHLHL